MNNLLDLSLTVLMLTHILLKLTSSRKKSAEQWYAAAHAPQFPLKRTKLEDDVNIPLFG